MQWHQLDHIQTICTLHQTDNHTNTPSLQFFTDQMLFLTPNQQCQITEGICTDSEQEIKYSNKAESATLASISSKQEQPLQCRRGDDATVTLLRKTTASALPNTKATVTSKGRWAVKLRSNKILKGVLHNKK